MKIKVDNRAVTCYIIGMKTTNNTNQFEALRAKRTKYNSIYNEGAGGYNPYDAQIASHLQAELDEAEAVRSAEWTLETTKARRVEWNNRIRSFGVNIDIKLIIAAEAKQGWTLTDLKTALKNHNL